MIQKPFYSLHSVAVVATEPKSGEMYGAEYQSLLWLVFHQEQIQMNFFTRQVVLCQNNS